MEILKSYLSRTRMHIASMGGATVAVAVVLALLVIGGGVWLVTASSSEAPQVALTPEPIDAAQLAVLVGGLDARGLAHTIRDGRLYVSAADLPAARQVVASPDLVCERAMVAYRTLLESDDFWADRAQRERKLRAARMALLSAQIACMPGVRSATVLLSPASEARIGRQGYSGGASIKLTTLASKPMDDALCETIAQMVCSSEGGIRRENVCIVDGQGRSYIPAPAFASDGVIARTRKTEAYYAARIRHALSYIGSVVVSVRGTAGPGGSEEIGRCLGVSVSIGRGHLVAAHRAQGKGQSLDAFADLRQIGIGQTVMREADLDDLRTVVVTWHDDVAGSATVGGDALVVKPPTATSGVTVGPMAMTIGVVVILAGVCLFFRRSSASSSPSNAHAAAGEPQADPVTVPSRPGGPFAFLLEISDKKLVSLLEGEHPQTTALVLAQLGPGKAAAVLAALGPQRQVDVVRRIASLGTPSGEVAGEIARGLAARLGRSTSVQAEPDGISTAAEILHHAGYDAEQAVLDALAGDEPDLADSIRRRMFVFDDIASLPTATVAEALGPLASEDIAVALRTAGRDIRDKVLSGLGAGAGPVREAMDRIGPVRLSDVEAAQQRLASAVRQACDGRYVVEADEASEETYIETGAA